MAETVEAVETAQDVIDALRFVLMAQKDPAERLRLLDALLELAPETDGERGIRLVLELIAEGSLKVALVGDDSLSGVERRGEPS